MSRNAAMQSARPSLVSRYQAHLPITDRTPELTLGEGFTPLVRLGLNSEAD